MTTQPTTTTIPGSIAQFALEDMLRQLVDFIVEDIAAGHVEALGGPPGFVPVDVVRMADAFPCVPGEFGDFTFLLNSDQRPIPALIALLEQMDELMEIRRRFLSAALNEPDGLGE